MISLQPGDNRRFPHGFAFDKGLEALATHRSIMPIVMELTGGRPQLAMGTLQADGHAGLGDFFSEGLALHRAGDEQQPGTGPQIGVGDDGRMFCNDMVFFPYLDTVGPADGGLVCLPGAAPPPPAIPPMIWSAALCA